MAAHEEALKRATTDKVSPAVVGAKPARKGRVSPHDLLVRVVFVVFLIALWQGAYHYFVTVKDIWSKGIFPSPSQVVEWLWVGFGFTWFTHSYQPPLLTAPPRNYWEVLQQVPYPRAIGVSLWRLVEGYLIAIVIGFPLGLWVARSSLADKTIGWLSNSLQGLPSICWVPLAMLWFGRISDAAPIMFVTVMGALFATVIAVADGLRNVPPWFSRAGRTLGATGARLYWGVLLPSAMPAIVTGLKIGWSFAWRSLMAAELIVNAGGLGQLLYIDREHGDADGVLATIFVIIVMGLAVQSLVFEPAERRLRALWGLNGA